MSVFWRNLFACDLRTVQDKWLPWRWGQQALSQSCNLYSYPYAVTTQSWIFSNTHGRISCLELSHFFLEPPVFSGPRPLHLTNKYTLFTECVHCVYCFVLFTDYCRIISIMKLPSLSVTLFQNMRTKINLYNYKLQPKRCNFSWIYFYRRSTCFRWFLHPSSGAPNCTYSFRYCQPILLLAATVEEMALAQ